MLSRIYCHGCKKHLDLFWDETVCPECESSNFIVLEQDETVQIVPRDNDPDLTLRVKHHPRP